MGSSGLPLPDCDALVLSGNSTASMSWFVGLPALSSRLPLFSCADSVYTYKEAALLHEQSEVGPMGEAVKRQGKNGRGFVARDVAMG